MSRQRREATRVEAPVVAGRVPPNDLDAEAAVISAIFNSRDALDQVSDLLKPVHYYSDANLRIYEAQLDLASRGQPTDIVTVKRWLDDRGRLAQVGGPAYLARLSDATPAVFNVRAHAQIVVDKWRVRQTIATCQVIAAEGYGDVGEAQAYIDRAEQSIYELARHTAPRQSRTIAALVQESVAGATEAAAIAAERRAAGESYAHITGVRTGFVDVDEMLDGLREADMIIVGGRPSMGKTAWALNAAVRMARAGEAVFVASLESRGKSLSDRMIASEARVDGKAFRQGRLGAEEWKRVTAAAVEVSRLPITVNDCPGGVVHVRAKARRVRPRVVIVDYLQRVHAEGRGENREQEVTRISQGLKDLANDLGVPVVVLAQLNRALHTRPDKRPVLSDLRESGSIEQDADVVAFLHREEYYHPDTPDRGLAEFIVAKQREGETGTVRLRFDRASTRFDNLANEQGGGT